MKKLFLLLMIATASCSAQISVKSIGVDSITGLAQRIVVSQINIDDDLKMILVNYRVETLAPNGAVVSFVRGTYMRTGSNFSALKSSPLGQGIIGIITNDLAPVNSIKDIPKLDQ